MQKTSKTEALAALSEWRTAGGGIPEKKHILRAFIDASPDTGEAVNLRPMLDWYVKATGDFGAEFLSEGGLDDLHEIIADITSPMGIEESDDDVPLLFTHPVTPEGIHTNDTPDHVEIVVEWLKERGLIVGDLSDPGSITDQLSWYEKALSDHAQPDLSVIGVAQGEREIFISGYFTDRINRGERPERPLSQASDTVPVSREDAALIVRALDDWEPGLADEERAALRLMKELGGENV